MEQLSPRELDSIYRATMAMTLEHWLGAYDERPKSGRRKLLVLPTLVVVVVAALCLISPDIWGIKL